MSLPNSDFDLLVARLFIGSETEAWSSALDTLAGGDASDLTGEPRLNGSNITFPGLFGTTYFLSDLGDRGAALDIFQLYIGNGGIAFTAAAGIRDGGVVSAIDVNSRSLMDSSGTIPVLDWSSQAGAIANATTAIDVINQLNSLLAALRTYGLIAT